MLKNQERSNFSEKAKQKSGHWIKTSSGRGEHLKVLFYSHDTMGLGHLQRNFKIANALKTVYPDLVISLLTGSTLTSYFELPSGIDYVLLPPVRKIGKEKYEAFYSENSFKSVLRKRKSIIIETVKDLSPDVFWVDHAPVGMKGELLPALDWITENRPSMLTVLGLRDIIDAPANIIPLWEEQGIYDVLRSSYKKIFIYGDKQIFNPLKELNIPPDIREKTEFTGYIINYNNGFSSEKTNIEPSAARRIFVTIGGGEWAGATIIGNILEAAKKYKNEPQFEVTIVTGPFLPDDLWWSYSEMARELPAKTLRFVADIRPLIFSSDLVVSTGGYNTVTDILGYGKRAIVIPRIKFRHEQFLRAKRFAELGIFEMLHPDDVTPDSLLKNIIKILDQNEKPVESARQKGSINLGGTGYITEHLKDLISIAN